MFPHKYILLVLHALVGMSRVATAAAVAFQICLPPKLKIHGAVHYQQQQQQNQDKKRKDKKREKRTSIVQVSLALTFNNVLRG